jgi:hypothetical protein
METSGSHRKHCLVQTKYIITSKLKNLLSKTDTEDLQNINSNLSRLLRLWDDHGQDPILQNSLDTILINPPSPKTGAWAQSALVAFPSQ